MTARDRTVLIVLGSIVAVAAFWFLAIGPKRKDASDLDAQVKSAEQRLSTAQSSAASAAAAKARYDSDYATVARLGKAVPVEDDVPALLYQLQTTADQHHIDFRKMALTQSGPAAPLPAAAAVASAAGSTTTPASTSAVTSALPPGATVGTAGFPTMPFAFDFNGSFFDMQKFFNALNGLTTVKGKQISVKGRLLTLDGFTLKAGPKGFPQVHATLAATAYLLPADEGLTGGASATAPGTQTASTTSSTAGGPTASMIGSH